MKRDQRRKQQLRERAKVESLAFQARFGAGQRFGSISAEVEARLQEEIRVMQNIGIVDDILSLTNIISRVKHELGVETMPSHGILAGSFVAYCLGLEPTNPAESGTQLDPKDFMLTLPLHFEICYDNDIRNEVVEWMKLNSCQISTYLGQPLLKLGNVRVHIRRRVQLAVNKDFSDSLSRLRHMAEEGARQRYDGTVPASVSERISMELDVIGKRGWEGCFISTSEVLGDARQSLPICLPGPGFGSAACSMVNYVLGITQIDPLKYNLPFERFASENMACCPDMMIEVDDDSLEDLQRMTEEKDCGIRVSGSRPLSIISRILDEPNLGIDGADKQAFLSSIPLDDEPTLELFRRGDTDGIHLFDSPGIREHLKNIKPDNFLELAAINAMYRPCVVGQLPEYTRRKQEGKLTEYAIPEMAEVLDETYGLLIYQEQIIQLAKSVGGMNTEEADALRLAISRRDGSEMHDRFLPLFIKGGRGNGYSEKRLKQIFSSWWEYGAYTFLKSHTLCKTLICYQMAYLKVHYPEGYEIVTKDC